MGGELASDISKAEATTHKDIAKEMIAEDEIASANSTAAMTETNQLKATEEEINEDGEVISEKAKLVAASKAATEKAQKEVIAIQKQLAEATDEKSQAAFEVEDRRATASDKTGALNTQTRQMDALSRERADTNAATIKTAKMLANLNKEASDMKTQQLSAEKSDADMKAKVKADKTKISEETEAIEETKKEMKEASADAAKTKVKDT